MFEINFIHYEINDKLTIKFSNGAPIRKKRFQSTDNRRPFVSQARIRFQQLNIFIWVFFNAIYTTKWISNYNKRLYLTFSKRFIINKKNMLLLPGVESTVLLSHALASSTLRASRSSIKVRRSSTQSTSRTKKKINFQNRNVKKLH